MTFRAVAEYFVVLPMKTMRQIRTLDYFGHGGSANELSLE